ncbi:hypothetical protein D9M72_617220 [compost metagenome]
MARQIDRESFDAATIFDRRFEKIAFDAINEYRSSPSTLATPAVPVATSGTSLNSQTP